MTNSHRDSDFRECAVSGCDRNAHWKSKGARGWCLMHYKRWRAHGSAEAEPVRMDNSGSCSVDGCASSARSLGMCNAHYLRSKSSGSPSGSGKAMRGDPMRFYVAGVLGAATDECVIWPFSRNKAGYGTMFSSNGDTTLVHRRACVEIFGEPPTDEHHAAHSCGNGHLGCVNPKHLRWALPVENAGDMIAHGTRWNKARGETHPSAKLSERDVLAILGAKDGEVAADVAKKFGVSVALVRAIWAGRVWRHVKS